MNNDANSTVNSSQTSIGDPVDQFLNQILDEKKISGDVPEIRPKLVADLRSRLMDQIDRSMINELNESQLDQFNALLDKPDTTDATIHQFFEQAGVDAQRVALETMLRFRGYYLGTLPTGGQTSQQ